MVLRVKQLNNHRRIGSALETSGFPPNLFNTYYFLITLTACNTFDVSVTHILFGVQMDGSFLMSHLNFKLLNTVVV